jgi:prepilin-type N-terminal cleavage/methylation domain-containing protein
MRRRYRTAFTLVELLVVIGIIALLISILLPSLNKAREAAARTQCMSNMRSLAQALNIYAAQNQGRFPPHLKGIDNYNTYPAYHPSWNTPEYNQGRLAADGYVGVGYLIRNGQIKDGKAFYCPKMEYRDLRYETWEPRWTEIAGKKQPTGGLLVGLLYRVHYQPVEPNITVNDCEVLNNLRLGKLGKFKGGMMALISEVPWYYNFNVWSHTKPYGLNVAYSDGHGEFVDMGKENYDTAVEFTRTFTRHDQWMYFHYMWFAIDRGDYGKFQELAQNRNWSEAMTHYGHY